MSHRDNFLLGKLQMKLEEGSQILFTQKEGLRTRTAVNRMIVAELLK